MDQTLYSGKTMTGKDRCNVLTTLVVRGTNGRVNKTFRKRCRQHRKEGSLLCSKHQEKYDKNNLDKEDKVMDFEK